MGSSCAARPAGLADSTVARRRVVGPAARPGADNSWLLPPASLMILDRGHRRRWPPIQDHRWASVSARAWHLLGLPCDQVELVALRVGERGLADRRHARWQRRGRECDLVERPG